MIYLLFGKDKARARDKALKLVKDLQKKKPDASVFKIDPENWERISLDEYIKSRGLFSSRYIVLMDSLLDDPKRKENILEKIKAVKESDNLFIFLEGELDKASLSKLQKSAEKAQEFNLIGAHSQPPNQEFNIFKLGDAFGLKDRKSLWVLYMKARREGVEAEQIHGILFWAVKNIILARECQNTKDSGLNPFVFSKARNFSKNFSVAELKNISSKLVSIYHEARMGKNDLENLLEKFVLEI